MKRASAFAALVLLAGCASQPAPETKREVPVFPARITQFYASPAAVPKGGKALLCYGVEARAVRIEPAVEDVKPSLARCIEVHPAATSEYKLIATGSDGKEVTQSITLTVDPKLRGDAPPAAAVQMIQFFSASQTEIAKGAGLTLCYGVKGAASVSITPNVKALEPKDRECFQLTLDQTTDFVLTAKSAAGATDIEKLRVAVR
ncbi:MAG: hypothetical protein U0Q16_27230 [Bryobacteraceae bacterium]